LKVDVIRDRGALARMVEFGKIENVYRLQVMNATEQPQRFAITVSGLDGAAVVAGGDVAVLPTEVRSVAVRVQVPPNSATPGSHPIHFQVVSTTTSGLSVDEKSVFLVPR
jgi:polyferredoxin